MQMGDIIISSFYICTFLVTVDHYVCPKQNSNLPEGRVGMASGDLEYQLQGLSDSSIGMKFELPKIS